ETTYTNPDNIDIVIQQRDSNYISYGDCVFIDNKIANDQTINFSKRRKLVIQNGKVVRTESKNKIRRYFSNMFKKTVSDDFNE
ncbi:MAG: hypothetical protein NTU43_10905, partial [Bacteroidetes bacterium]|nr:hypothetical protein [Bacteroidota bacterium]